MARAALLAAEDADGPNRVHADHLDGALAELRQSSGDLTSTLLAAGPAPSGDPAP